MRIALITPLYAPFVGGVEQHVGQLAREMTQRGHAVDILTTDPTGRLPAHDESARGSIRRFRSYGRGAFWLAPKLGRWLSQNRTRYDVLHAHSYHQPLILQAATATGATPLVLTTHYHGVGHTPLARAMHRPYRPFGNWALHRATRIVSTSAVERALLVRHFGQLPIVWIPNGVDVPSLLATSRPDAPDTRTRVLSVGRLEPYKQPMRLLEAVEHLPDSYVVSFIGDGSLCAELPAKASQLAVAANVEVRGRVSDEEVRQAFRASDVFVALSLQESFGLTLLEAAVSGAAVVASDIPPHREVAGYVPPDRIDFVPPDASPASIADAIVTASQRGRLEAQADWAVPTWASVAEQILELYAECGDNGNTR
jgi:glycosyltransferase involved in cell wall biosynthesis